ncbi:hypothetical protein T484DRAFT_2113816 [Baffinella frigidus]|nr:hypothetical protein T484DRAFT_2113816 [Cryptophyta sp. CCMP2293]
MWQWTKHVPLLALGQTVSLLLVGTNCSAAVLADRGFDAPTLLAFLNYLLLAIVYTSWVACHPPPPPLPEEGLEEREHGARTLLPCGPRISFLLFALVDVQANFLIVKAYQYTRAPQSTEPRRGC